MNDRQDRALALAGVFQASACVHRIAWHGADHSEDVAASLGSLFTFDAATPAAVFGGFSGVAPGLRVLTRQLGDEPEAADAPIMTYTLGLLHLERRADARPGLWPALHTGLRAAQRQVDAFGLVHANTISALAALYADHISTAGPRIMVEGEQVHLRDPSTAALIRALLLAGIRAAVLWRQLGASRWSLLLRRGALVADARAWLSAGGSGPLV